MSMGCVTVKVDSLGLIVTSNLVLMTAVLMAFAKTQPVCVRKATLEPFVKKESS